MFGTVLKLLLLKDLKTAFRQKRQLIAEIILLFFIVPGFIALNVLTSVTWSNYENNETISKQEIIRPWLNLTPVVINDNFTTSTTFEPWTNTTTEDEDGTTTTTIGYEYGNDTNATTKMPRTAFDDQDEFLPRHFRRIEFPPTDDPDFIPPPTPYDDPYLPSPPYGGDPLEVTLIPDEDVEFMERVPVARAVADGTDYENTPLFLLLKAADEKSYQPIFDGEYNDTNYVYLKNCPDGKFFEKLNLTCGTHGEFYFVRSLAEIKKAVLPNFTIEIKNYNDHMPPSFEYKIIFHDRENEGWHNEPYMIPDLFGVPFPPIENSYSDLLPAKDLQFCLDLAFYHQYNEATSKLDTIFPPINLTTESGPEPAQNKESMFHGALMALFEIIIPILISIPTLITGHELCEEKENNIHTFMVVMGLDRSLCILSHLIFAIAKMYIYILPIGITVILCFEDIGWYIFLLLFLYSHVYISSIFLILSFTKKTTVVIFVTATLIVLGIVLGYILPLTIFNIEYSSALSFLVPHLAFKYGLNHLTKVVVYHQEINFFAAPIYMPLWISVVSLLFQAILYLFLAFYFDAVLPIDDSPKKHPFFIFGRTYDDVLESKKEGEMESLLQAESSSLLPPSSSQLQEASSSAFSEMYFETDKNRMDPEIDVSHLSKKWSNDQFGIYNISFKAYPNQVTALLGHNGAGKSTTFSLITGFTKSTFGKVYVCGKEPRNLCQSSSVGYCPQWDPLFPHLDVREHLKFYQSLKGENNPYEIEDMIEKLGLSDFVYYRAKFLSGGMRRKLCVGMAMIGNSRVILLDEPMVGMDTLSRKQLIEIIRSAKSEHAILLATHYMDVADEVSDRIIILSNGKIVCNGSSNFLKANVETGFLLIVEFTKAIGMESYQYFAHAVLAIVTKYCKEAKIDGSANRQFTIFLPRNSQRTFPSIFYELELQKESLQINSYDIQANKLEQVFIKVTEEVESNKQKNAEDVIKEFLEKRDEAYTGCKLFFSQIFGLLMRKHHYTRRHYIRSVIPHTFVAMFLIYFFVVLYGPGQYYQKDASTAIKDYDPMTVVLYNNDKTTNQYRNVLNRFPKKVNLKNVHEAIQLKDYEALIYSNIPLTFAIVLEEQNRVTVISRAPFPNGAAIALNLLGNALFDRPDVIKTTISIEGVSSIAASSGLMLCFFMIFPVAFMITIYLHVEENEKGIVHLYQRTQMKLLTYWLASFIFDFIYAMIPISILTAITLVFGNGLLLKMECWPVLLPGILLIVLVFLLQSYVFSSFFTSSTLAVITFLIYNIILSSIGFIVFENLLMDKIVYLSILFPVISINNLVMSKNSKVKNSIFSFCLGDSESPPCLGIVYSIIFGNIAFYSFVLLICIYRRQWMLSCRSNQPPADLTPYKENEDVLEERKNVESLGPDAYQIYTKDLRKMYSGLVAVRDITMGVQKSECFGLLGANGAGKSTFFNMLTATMSPTSGDGFVGDVDIRKQPLFGFCPQKSRLIPELSIKETLYFFARLNGIKLKKEIIEIICESFYFSKIEDTLVERISGGELRRLSIAIALLTSSEILMLDEPTTGVDPRTRRHIWNLLISLRSNGGSSQLLTSHSMEECEALCTKIGFINHGIFIGIGTVQHLKNRFGNTHRLIITLNGPNKEFAQKMNTEMKSIFNTTPISVDGNVPDLIWSIPKSTESLSGLYTRLIQFIDAQPKQLENEEETIIKDFAIVGTNLEEVFARMADTKVKYEFRF